MGGDPQPPDELLHFLLLKSTPPAWAGTEQMPALLCVALA